MAHHQARIGRIMALPTVWLLTDERVGTSALLNAVRRLPRGSGLILRHYRTPQDERHALFLVLQRIARRRDLLLSVAASGNGTTTQSAQGLHGAPTHGEKKRSPRKTALRTMPAHDLGEIRAAERAGADAVLVSPLFATRSHPGARPLGAARFAALTRLSRIPVLALGGIRPRHQALVRQLGAVGYAAIDGLTR
jgi:thiamine-phosphate pyrophosphorylase